MAFWNRKKQPHLLGKMGAAISAGADETVKEGAKQIADDAIRNWTLGIVREATSVALASLGASFAGKAVETLLKGTDKNTKLLEGLSSMDYKTGSRMVREALSVHARNQDEENRRQERLKSGIEFLESGLSIAKDQDERMYILFLIGMSEALLPGGLPFAVKRICALQELGDQRLNHVDVRISQLRTDEPLPPASMDYYEQNWQNRSLSHDRGWIAPASQLHARASRERERFLSELRPLEDARKQLLSITQFCQHFIQEASGEHTGKRTDQSA